MRRLGRSNKRIVLLNDGSDLKSTMLTGRSFHRFTTLIPEKEVLFSAATEGFVQFIGMSASACATKFKETI